LLNAVAKENAPDTLSAAGDLMKGVAVAYAFRSLILVGIYAMTSASSSSPKGLAPSGWW
jgi:hypothetical protein